MKNYEHNPFHWVNRLGFLSRKRLAHGFRVAGHSVSPEEWAILLVLWNKGPQTPSALADVTIKDRTTVTRLIDAMVRKKLVKRAEDPDDRRRSVVIVDTRGAQIKPDLVSVAQSFTETALDGIPKEDIETTLETLRTMAQNLHTGPQQETNDDRI